jgi:hypothetical protein
MIERDTPRYASEVSVGTATSTRTVYKFEIIVIKRSIVLETRTFGRETGAAAPTVW